MTTPIPEAAVEAAAKIIANAACDWHHNTCEDDDHPLEHSNWEAYTDDARAALTAARPHMEAQALREFRAGLGRRFWLKDPYGHFGQEAVSAFHRQIEGLLDAEIATIAERTQR